MIESPNKWPQGNGATAALFHIVQVAVPLTIDTFGGS
jgi:hypothetical protein